jgi:hypothetical protein
MALVGRFGARALPYFSTSAATRVAIDQSATRRHSNEMFAVRYAGTPAAAYARASTALRLSSHRARMRRDNRRATATMARLRPTIGARR